MNVIKLNKDEHKEQLMDLYRLCFAAKFTSESFKDYINSDDLWDYIWGVIENNTLIASYVAYEGAVKIRRIPFRVNYFDGFVTRPGFRNKGMGRKLFDNQKNIAAKRGIRLFALDPFKNAFYKKFGFEDALDSLKITIPMRNFSRNRVNDKYSVEVISAYHSKAAEKAVRDVVKRNWNEGFYNPMKIPEAYFLGAFRNETWKICILRDQRNTVRGTLLYEIKERKLIVYTFSLFDLKGFLTMKDFLSQFRDQIDQITLFKAPPDFPLDLFIDSFHAGSSRITVSAYPTRMMQILDIKYVLKQIINRSISPCSETRVCFTDNNVEKNNIVLLLSDSGVEEVDDNDFDMQVSVSDFVPVFTGKTRISEQFAKGFVRVNGYDNPDWNRDKHPDLIKLFDKVFPECVTHNCEYCF